MIVGASRELLKEAASRRLFFARCGCLLPVIRAQAAIQHPPLWLVIPAQAEIQLSSLGVIPAQAGIHVDLVLSLVLEVQSFVSPTASRLLFGIAQKVTKKARHRTQCFAAHRARQNTLCFSGTAGSSESTSMCSQPTRAHRARAPSGNFRRTLRCSALRTAPVNARTRASLHCVVGLVRSLAKPAARTKKRERLLLRQDAAQTGPHAARRVCGGKARRVARTMRASSLRAHGCALNEPRSTLAKSEGRMPGDRATGGVLSLVTFFAQAKKVTRLPEASGSSALSKVTRSAAGRTAGFRFTSWTAPR